jgi:hypothetical protein
MSDASTAAVLLTLLGTSAPAPIQPVRLVVSESGPHVVLRVVGHSDRQVDARYVLTSASAGNSAKQAGRARLEPGKIVTLVTLKLGPRQDASWHAQLTVELGDGTRYELSRKSS